MSGNRTLEIGGSQSGLLPGATDISAWLPAEFQPIVRALPKLKKTGTSWKDYRKEAEPTAFWARYDAGEFRADSK